MPLSIIPPSSNSSRPGRSTLPGFKDHYLQLPDNLSSRITELARNITASAETPYDKAIAITNYLRSTITYSPRWTAPPAGTDPLVWFLFDTRKGFCNYYATAEVILLRSVGVPARMVVGFCTGRVLTTRQVHRPARRMPTPGRRSISPASGGWSSSPPVSQPVLNRLPGIPTPTQQPFNATQNAGQNNAGSTPTPESGSRSEVPGMEVDQAAW